MGTDIWGPSTWHFLHTVAYSYPSNPTQNDINNYFNFYNKIQYILPCSRCREGYSNLIKEYPIKLDSKDNLIYWLINIHNKVNQKLNKPEKEYNDMLEFIQTPLVKKPTINNEYLYIIIIILLILLLCISYNKKNKLLFY